MDTLAANFSTDQNKLFSWKNVSLSRSLLKIALVQHFVNCDSLVFQTGACLLLKVHFYFVFQQHIMNILFFIRIYGTIIISKFKKTFHNSCHLCH